MCSFFYHECLAFRESDEKLKDELVEKIKANVPEAKVTSEVGEGGLVLMLIRI